MPGVALISIDGLSAGLLADPALRVPALRGLAVAPTVAAMLGIKLAAAERVASPLVLRG